MEGFFAFCSVIFTSILFSIKFNVASAAWLKAHATVYGGTVEVMLQEQWVSGAAREGTSQLLPPTSVHQTMLSQVTKAVGAILRDLILTWLSPHLSPSHFIELELYLFFTESRLSFTFPSFSFFFF